MFEKVRRSLNYHKIEQIFEDLLDFRTCIRRLAVHRADEKLREKK